MMRRGGDTLRAANRDRHRLWSDNLVLVPASQLPFKDEWARIAEGLPHREALVVVPKAETPLKQVARALVPQLRAHGRHVTAIVDNGKGLQGDTRHTHAARRYSPTAP